MKLKRVIHLSPRQAASRRYQARHRVAGLCILCSKPRSRESVAYCDWHREKRRLRQRRLRGPVFCRRCHQSLSEKERGQGRRYHHRCSLLRYKERVSSSRYRRLHLKAVRAYQRWHAEAGLCTECPQPAVPGRTRCARHLRYSRERHWRLKGGGYVAREKRG